MMTRPILILVALGLTSVLASAAVQATPQAGFTRSAVVLPSQAMSAPRLIPAAHRTHAHRRSSGGRCPTKPFIHAYDGWCYAIDWWNYTPADGGHVYPYGRPSTAHLQWCKAAYPRYNPRNNTWRDEHGSLHICTSSYH